MQLLRQKQAGTAARGRSVAFKGANVRALASRGGEQETSPSLLQKCALTLLSAATAAVPLSVAPVMPVEPAHALLTAGDPIKNAQAILRYALPIDNKPIRQIQRDLESIADALRIPGSKSLGPVSRSVRSAANILTSQKSAILGAVAADKKAEGEAAYAKLEKSLTEFQGLIDAKDKQQVPIKQRECLDYVGDLEESMMKGFPFSVPKEYADRPLLLGRAMLQMEVNSETPQGRQDLPMTIVLDGYNAPVSAGQFLDLVERKFYDGMEVQRADGFVVQTGDPDGPSDGFVDPSTKELRKVPMEIKVVGEKEPVYEFNLEDLGRYNEQPALPFNAYGTLAWARAEFDNNSASSQIFFLLKESELTPSGANLLDGRYAVFGYVTQGQDALGYAKVGDKIKYIKCVKGAENLLNGYKPGSVAAPAVADAPAE